VESVQQEVGAEPALLEAGWTRRFMGEPSRAEESAEIYEQLGLEVLLAAPAPQGFAEGCQGCAKAACSAYLVVYTRRKREEER